MEIKKAPGEIITKCVLVYAPIFDFGIEPTGNDKITVFIKNDETVQISKIKSGYKTRKKIRDVDLHNEFLVYKHRKHRIIEMSSKRRIDYAPGEITDIIRSY
jgi:hypothetical protein